MPKRSIQTRTMLTRRSMLENDIYERKTLVFSKGTREKRENKLSSSNEKCYEVFGRNREQVVLQSPQEMRYRQHLPNIELLTFSTENTQRRRSKGLGMRLGCQYHQRKPERATPAIAVALPAEIPEMPLALTTESHCTNKGSRPKYCWLAPFETEKIGNSLCSRCARETSRAQPYFRELFKEYFREREEGLGWIRVGWINRVKVVWFTKKLCGGWLTTLFLQLELPSKKATNH